MYLDCLVYLLVEVEQELVDEWFELGLEFCIAFDLYQPSLDFQQFLEESPILLCVRCLLCASVRIVSPVFLA
jgi:hypothetical protein